ncbi:rRNA maturation RNase YbeY [Salinimicrobium oceani]|uniref:Endoribonuclease YbeY n=1 Tax=Salinimicrobium oceani TaxID=2722702 RepID=A0ABX1CUL6_9FLAO|nr:rRNA maturation RNase YbeY [Salinimicrobium oceani]NJW51978.1 rRNA maturation RNase YbeY [Salinimicrobium oceani]
MINFYSENEFELENPATYENWVKRVIASEGKKTGEISFIFCDDDYLLEINKKYLDHDTYTDIISFDNTVGNILNGDIFISTQRVSENAETYHVSGEEELRRVIIHGVLHLCGYHDKTSDEAQEMRVKEEEKMKMFHVEQ